MLIILTICLVLMSAMLLLLKKSRESLYLMGLCVSLMLEICGVMIFIAKKGGISLEVVHFLYFSKAVQTRLQYFLITLNQLGYLIAIGRFLFPLFLVEMALKAFHGSCYPQEWKASAFCGFGAGCHADFIFSTNLPDPGSRE